MQVPSGPPFSRNVAQSLEHPAWDREAAGENPAIPTISTLPWPNISGIRLLSGQMQVRILPAAPLPGGVKVARRPVKPLVLVRVQVWQPIFRRAGRYKLAAPVPKTGSAQTRGRSVIDALRQFQQPKRKEIP